jgi:hypothetical protein
MDSDDAQDAEANFATRGLQADAVVSNELKDTNLSDFEERSQYAGKFFTTFMLPPLTQIHEEKPKHKRSKSGRNKLSPVKAKGLQRGSRLSLLPTMPLDILFNVRISVTFT